MIVKLLEAYYKYFWLLLAAIAIFKILLTFIFNTNIAGLQGLLYAIFKWYGEADQEMAETPARKTMMRFQNVVSMFMYFILLVIIVISLLPMFIAV